MNSALGCPYVAGPACRDCDGSCWEPEPTCADYGHPPAAEDEEGRVYCACGQSVSPPALARPAPPETTT